VKQGVRVSRRVRFDALLRGKNELAKSHPLEMAEVDAKLAEATLTL
jgi:hypothetical protein